MTDVIQMAISIIVIKAFHGKKVSKKQKSQAIENSTA
jgi:hypothetical protein